MAIRIHKEGYKIIATISTISIAVAVAASLWTPWLGYIFAFSALLNILFTLRFFRVPHRIMPQCSDRVIYSPADGEIVAIEEVLEGEYLDAKALKVSVFMSVWNVHINWFPVSGKVLYFKHHDGKYLVAWAEKSSEVNERTTTVVDTGKHIILFRQIAGFVARRIVNRTEIGSTVKQCTECGFIKFGSRMDIYLPLNSEVVVKIGEKVTGTQTILAHLK